MVKREPPLPDLGTAGGREKILSEMTLNRFVCPEAQKERLRFKRANRIRD